MKERAAADGGDEEARGAAEGLAACAPPRRRDAGRQHLARVVEEARTCTQASGHRAGSAKQDVGRRYREQEPHPEHEPRARVERQRRDDRQQHHVVVFPDILEDQEESRESRPPAEGRSAPSCRARTIQKAIRERRGAPRVGRACFPRQTSRPAESDPHRRDRPRAASIPAGGSKADAPERPAVDVRRQRAEVQQQELLGCPRGGPPSRDAGEQDERPRRGGPGGSACGAEGEAQRGRCSSSGRPSRPMTRTRRHGGERSGGRSAFLDPAFLAVRRSRIQRKPPSGTRTAPSTARGRTGRSRARARRGASSPGRDEPAAEESSARPGPASAPSGSPRGRSPPWGRERRREGGEVGGRGEVAEEVEVWDPPHGPLWSSKPL